jgi:hypothetical protein
LDILYVVEVVEGRPVVGFAAAAVAGSVVQAEEEEALVDSDLAVGQEHCLADPDWVAAVEIAKVNLMLVWDLAEEVQAYPPAVVQVQLVVLAG